MAGNFVRSSFWGVFEREFGEPVHVAPCTKEFFDGFEEGVLAKPHELSMECFCQPELQGNIIVHKWVQ